MKPLKNLRIRAYAKINLYLDVLSKRTDGYHNIETIFHSIDLHDEVILRERSKTGIILSCNHPAIPKDSTNIAYRAAAAIGQLVGGLAGLEIQINKRIPVAAGLAGGSANAAAVLYGVNEMFRLGLSRRELAQIGTTIGADIPFCLNGGAALGTGIGDLLTPLPPIDNMPILLINPGFPVSTADVFNNLNIPLTKPENGSIIIKKCVEKGNITGIANNLYNFLEPQVYHKYPELTKLKTQLTTQAGCWGALMSGSGATIFAIMCDMNAAQKSKAHFKNKAHANIITTTHPVGICIDH